MYIENRYWNNYIGDTDDSLTLVGYLEDKGKETLSLKEIFEDTGLSELNGKIRRTEASLEYTDREGREHSFYYAIDLVTDLAALLLECRVSGNVSLKELSRGYSPDRTVRITAAPEEHDWLNGVLKDFAENPLEYDLAEMMDEDSAKEMAQLVERLRKELYEADGSSFGKADTSADAPEPEEEKEMSEMDLLEQCQIWHENDEHTKIIGALEEIPEEERTAAIDMELARAYNNLADPADPEGRKALWYALGLLRGHREELEDDYSWNFRMGYAYYYLDQEGPAMRYLKRALELHPGDDPRYNTEAEIRELIDDCRHRLSLPRFEENFRGRTIKTWAAFEQIEAELRRIMDEDARNERGEELIAKCEEVLHLTFHDISFEMGFNGQKYELILTPEGDKVRLFELVYFKRHAPDSLLDRWNFLVGRQPVKNCGLRSGEWEVSGEDVQVWTERLGDHSVGLNLYCEKLLPLLKEDENRAWWMLSTLIDQVLGEIPNMMYIETIDLLETPKEGTSIPLTDLSEVLEDMGLHISLDPQEYLENSYVGYHMEPNEDRDAEFRMDVIAGSTSCVPLLNDYLNDESDGMDELHLDGAVGACLCYPLYVFDGEDRSQKIFDFRDALENAVEERAGREAVTLTGGATGVHCGYVDCIIWDLDPFLEAARSFFETTSLPWAVLRVLRRDAQAVTLFDREEDSNDEEREEE